MFGSTNLGVYLTNVAGGTVTDGSEEYYELDFVSDRFQDPDFFNHVNQATLTYLQRVVVPYSVSCRVRLSKAAGLDILWPHYVVLSPVDCCRILAVRHRSSPLLFT